MHMGPFLTKTGAAIFRHPLGAHVKTAYQNQWGNPGFNVAMKGHGMSIPKIKSPSKETLQVL